LGCLGSDNVERSYQPRLITLSIVPDYVKEPVKTPGVIFPDDVAKITPVSLTLNILQTVVLVSHVSAGPAKAGHYARRDTSNAVKALR